MAITRPKEYKNFVPPDTGKAYQISGNADGTSKITDVTQYLSEGDTWTAADANMIWDELENVITGEEKGVAGGVASLGADGLVLESQLPEIGAVKSVNGQTGEVVTVQVGTTELTDKVSPLADKVIYCLIEG